MPREPALIRADDRLDRRPVVTKRIRQKLNELLERSRDSTGMLYQITRLTGVSTTRLAGVRIRLSDANIFTCIGQHIALTADRCRPIRRCQRPLYLRTKCRKVNGKFGALLRSTRHKNSSGRHLHIVAKSGAIGHDACHTRGILNCERTRCKVLALNRTVHRAVPDGVRGSRLDHWQT